MKILLTGATGFIGSQLTKHLLSEGHSVAILVRPESNLDVLQYIISNIKVYVIDYTYTGLLQAVGDEQPDIVIHLASLFLSQHNPNDTSRLIESNINFPVQLLEVMCQLGVKQFLNTGTSWQHYENHIYSPVNLYAATKQGFEAILSYYVQVKNFKVITLKLFDTYGAGDTRQKLFSLLRKAAKTGEVLKMSYGEQSLDLVYISDVVKAYSLMIKKLSKVKESECYAISSSTQIKLKKLVQLYSKCLGKDLEVKWGALPYREREVMNPWSSYELVPDWVASVSLSEGIILMEKDYNIKGLLSQV